MSDQPSKYRAATCRRCGFTNAFVSDDVDDADEWVAKWEARGDTTVRVMQSEIDAGKRLDCICHHAPSNRKRARR